MDELECIAWRKFSSESNLKQLLFSESGPLICQSDYKLVIVSIALNLRNFRLQLLADLQGQTHGEVTATKTMWK